MKKLLPLFILLTCISPLYAQTHTWTQKKSLGYNVPSRYEAAMTSLNDKLYLMGGYDAGGSGQVTDFLEYDPATRVYKNLKELPGGGNPNSNLAFTAAGRLFTANNGGGWVEYDFAKKDWISRGYLPVSFTGQSSGFVSNDTIFVFSATNNDFYSYNVISNTWNKRANYPGTPRRSAISFEIAGKGYFGGGNNQSTNCNESACFLQDFYEYDISTDTWTSKANLPVKFKNAVAYGHNGKGYAGLGQFFTTVNGSPMGIPTSTWYEYNPVSNTWGTKAAAPYATANAAISKIGNDLFVFGGGNKPGYGGSSYSFLMKYNISTDSWAINETVSGGNRKEAAGFYANDKIYLGGGHDGQSLRDFWEYDLTTNNWSPKASFKSTYTQRAVVTLNGKGYFIGGYEKNIPTSLETYSDSLLEYNPATDRWTALANFPAGKRGGMAAFTINGKIFAGLGYNSEAGGQNYKDFYVYDPGTNSWNAIASVPFTGAEGTSTSHFALADTGYVYSRASGNLYAYNTNDNTWTKKASNAAASGGDVQNSSFTFAGKAYMQLSKAYTSDQNQLDEYNPITNSWRSVSGLPFKNYSGNVIETPGGAFFGFGNSNQVEGYYNFQVSNSWWQLTMQGAVSTQTGDFSSIGNVLLQTGGSKTVYDHEGKLFVSVQAKSITAGPAIEVRSIDPGADYRVLTQNYGNATPEQAMFLNKNFKIGALMGAQIRMYYTNAEIEKFITAFNNQYGTNKTINDIRILTSFGGVDPLIDLNPLNNTGPSINFQTITPSVNNYGSSNQYKYFEFDAPQHGLYGEVYAVLTVPVPVAPVLQAATEIVPSSFKAHWKPSLTAVSYRLDVSADNFQTFVPQFYDKIVSDTSQVITGLDSNTVYQYRVRAINSGGLSSLHSNASSATTPLPTRTLTIITNVVFDAIPFNETKTAILQIGNTGNSNLTVSGIVYPSKVFTGPFSGIIAPGATQEVTVTFAPDTTGNFNGTLTINSNSTHGVNTGGIYASSVKAKQTISFDSLPEKYAMDGEFDASGTASSGLPVNYTSSDTTVASILPSGRIQLRRAGSTVITASQAGNAFWEPASNVNQTLLVSKKTQTIVFATLPVKNVGDAEFGAGAIAGSGLAVSYTSSNTAVATVVSGKIQVKEAGTTTITASQEGNSEWSAAAAVSQILTVSKKTQSITFAALPAKVMSDGDFEGGATASSGLAITYTSSNPSVATIVNGKLRVVGVGNSVITASQPGNATWAAAADITQTLTVGAVFSLPKENFSISAIGETCKSENNGSINITASQNLNYTATITGNATNLTNTFTNSVTFPNLPAGNYAVCITVAGEKDYKQCYDLTITEPQDLSLFSTVDQSNNTLSLDLKGGESYRIMVNKEVYFTSENSIVLPLSKGKNMVTVSTNRDCQGTVVKEIFVSDQITVYPNPFVNLLNVTLGHNGSKNGKISINTIDGRVVYLADFVNKNGELQVDLSGLNNGLYYLKLSMDNSETIYKILKK